MQPTVAKTESWGPAELHLGPCIRCMCTEWALLPLAICGPPQIRVQEKDSHAGQEEPDLLILVETQAIAPNKEEVNFLCYVLTCMDLYFTFIRTQF